ncbi:MAG: DUF2019 domain-containing protein [Pseudomonadota bacterium]
MRKTENPSSSDLVSEFLRISLAQYEAMEKGEIYKYNRLIKKIPIIKQLLKSMPGDQRHLLLALYSHQNIFVRLQSAQVTKDIAPSAAKRIFEEVMASRIYPYAADAAESLRNLEGKA